MSIIYLAYFFGLLVNSGSEQSIATVNELIQSGIEYEYASDIDILQFSDHLYDIIKKNRKTCTSMYKCLQRVIERNDFEPVIDNFHAEYFRTKLLIQNIPLRVCTLQEVILIFSVAMYMAKGNPLLHRFSKVITGIFEAGLYEKWQKYFMSSSRLGDHTIQESSFLKFVTSQLNGDDKLFSLAQLHLLFYSLLISQMCSVLVLVAEGLYHKICIPAATSTKSPLQSTR
jgi:hypothetical protein